MKSCGRCWLPPDFAHPEGIRRRSADQLGEQLAGAGLQDVIAGEPANRRAIEPRISSA